MNIRKLISVIVVGLTAGMIFAPIQAAAAPSLPDNIFSAPVMPGGAVAKTEDTAVEVVYDLPYEKVLAWYQESFKNYKDEKYRDWKDQMYIEDQGAAKWHSIGIFKGGGARTTVRIVRDNWTWIFSTLFIRFAGVFVVLILLWMLLNLSSFIMCRFVIKEGKEQVKICK